MNNITTLYEIVPVNDGIHYMCIDKNGNYFRQHKAYTIKEQLAFYDESVAQAYIDKYMDNKLYVTERFGYDLSGNPFDVITEVK